MQLLIRQVKDKIKKWETSLLIIPSDLTWILQLLHIIISKVFKERLRYKYVGYWIGKNNIKESKSEVIEWIDESWYLNFVIINNNI